MTQTPYGPQSHGRRFPWPGILALALTGVPATARDLDGDLPARLREPMQRFVDRGEGILDSDRADVAYGDWRGHKLDRAILELLQSG